MRWSCADTELRPGDQAELWEHAAVAFTNVVEAGKVADKLKKESAYAAVLAWKNALAAEPRGERAAVERRGDHDDRGPPKPRPILERAQKLMHAFDLYIDAIKDPAVE